VRREEVPRSKSIFLNVVGTLELERWMDGELELRDRSVGIEVQLSLGSYLVASEDVHGAVVDDSSVMEPLWRLPDGLDAFPVLGVEVELPEVVALETKVVVATEDVHAVVVDYGGHAVAPRR